MHFSSKCAEHNRAVSVDLQSSPRPNLSSHCLLSVSSLGNLQQAHTHIRDLHAHAHTHRLTGPFSGTTQVSRYHKGKTNLDFSEARDSEWQWHQLGHMQVCTICKSAPHSIQITTPAPHHSVFYRPDALPATQPTASKH